MTQLDWTHEQITELTTLWDEGHSIRAIGRVMERSPSSVAGKVRRLGLTPRGDAPLIRFDDEPPIAISILKHVEMGWTWEIIWSGRPEPGRGRRKTFRDTWKAVRHLILSADRPPIRIYQGNARRAHYVAEREAHANGGPQPLRP